jgi:hypothetical protein
MSVCYLPDCPTTCGGSVADVSFNECAPETHYGEVSKLYIVDANFPGFVNAGDLAEWTPLTSDTEDGHIRTLTVIGDLPEAETTEIPLSGDRVVYGFKTFNLNFTIDETNETNYAFLKTLECPGKVIIWFETSDGLLFGGDTGIEVSIKINMVIPRERTALLTFVGKATWKALTSPCRVDSPWY